MKALRCTRLLMMLIGLGGLIGPGPAWAGSVTQTFNLNLDAIGSVNTFDALQVAQFAPSAGTLTAVSFDLSYSTSGSSWEIINAASQAISVQFYDDTWSIGFAAPYSGGSSQQYTLHGGQTVSVGANSTYVVPEIALPNDSFAESVPSTSLAAYVGTGTQEVDVYTSSTFATGYTSPQPGTYPISQQVDNPGTTTATLTVTYTFTGASVPEPSTAVLLGSLGVCLLGYRMVRPGRRGTGPSGRA